MVFFTCDACGDSVKKAQVEKHYLNQCRQCNKLSCVDCGKDFWGDEYKEHNKCMTEDEKYGGKNYKPKPGQNKGEAKQELWTEQLQSAVAKVNANPKLKAVLQQIIDFPNIPRKKAKFVNFLKNSLRIQPFVAEEAWAAIDREVQLQKTDKAVPMEENKPEESSTVQHESIEDEKPKLTKKERKEQRSGKKQKTLNGSKQRNGDRVLPSDVTNGEDSSNTSQKRKHDNTQSDDTAKQKKKKQKLIEDRVPGIEPNLNREMAEAEDHQSKVAKFKWDASICSILKQNGGEMKVKKLRRKVLSAYTQSCGSENILPDEKQNAKLSKKLSNSSKYRLLKECVSLVHS